MKAAYIVCGDDLDATVLQRLLPEELLNSISVVPAGRLSSMKSMARTLAVSRQVPIAIVADAETVTHRLLEERRREIQAIVEAVAVKPVGVILAVPMIEAIFFQDIPLLSRLLGYEPSQETLNLAVYDAEQALQQLLSKSKKCRKPAQLIEQLTDEDVQILRKAPMIQELLQFLQPVRETVDAV